MNALCAKGDGKGLIRRIPAPKGISFVPGLISYTMRWTNRSTFQQVIEFTGHAARHSAG